MTASPDRRAVIAAPRPESLRRQESVIILLNLAVLAGIALAHALFSPVFGTPPGIFFAALLGRLLMQTIELMVIASVEGPAGDRFLIIYSRLSVWAHLAFAVLLSYLAGVENSHYVVLMVIPVIAAAFRYRTLGISLVVLAASVSTLLEVAIHRGFLQASPGEYFEAVTVIPLFVVVALVVALLVRQLREEQAATEDSLKELAATRDRLVQEEKLAAVGRLSGAIAHEIRNPVAMIVSSLDMSRRGGEDMLSREDLDGIIDQEARRLERLTTDFLSYARERAPNKKRQSVATLLGYVASLAQARLAQTHVELAIDCPRDLEVDFDAFQIEQALLNLLLNAIEASTEGGVVALGARSEAAEGSEESDLVLFVETGAGPIPPEVTVRLFEPFFTTKPQGTGLGLAITRRLARAHGGDADLSVNEPGRVRFDLRLPGPVAEVVEEVAADGTYSHR